MPHHLGKKHGGFSYWLSALYNPERGATFLVYRPWTAPTWQWLRAAVWPVPTVRFSFSGILATTPRYHLLISFPAWWKPYRHTKCPYSRRKETNLVSEPMKVFGKGFLHPESAQNLHDSVLWVWYLSAWAVCSGWNRTFRSVHRITSLTQHIVLKVTDKLFVELSESNIGAIKLLLNQFGKRSFAFPRYPETGSLYPQP